MAEVLKEKPEVKNLEKDVSMANSEARNTKDS